jgi:hypothetical protein
MPPPDQLDTLVHDILAGPPRLAWTWERVCIRIAATIGLVAWVLFCLRVIAWAIH